jgi:acyl-CoA synthetase (AMP-forming)/AMP-acid ligase II
LGRHPDIRECVVFGVADDKWGEAAHAAIELHNDTTTSAADITEFVKQQLDSVKAPKAVHITRVCRAVRLAKCCGVPQKSYSPRAGDLPAIISTRSDDD